jgi:hypothetical protein
MFFTVKQNTYLKYILFVLTDRISGFLNLMLLNILRACKVTCYKNKVLFMIIRMKSFRRNTAYRKGNSLKEMRKFSGS